MDWWLERGSSRGSFVGALLGLGPLGQICDGFQFLSELKEGENRKPGCLRFAEAEAGMWNNERLRAIDNANYYLTYTVEESVFCGGLRNYVARVQVCNFQKPTQSRVVNSEC